MSLEEIVCIENVVDFQATYFILDLKVSRLIEMICREIMNGVLPILNTRILLHTLKSAPFTDEVRGVQILDELIECMEERLYLHNPEWTIEKIMKNVLRLERLILWNYIIEGSLVVYINNEITWDSEIKFILQNNHVQFYNIVENWNECTLF